MNLHLMALVVIGGALTVVQAAMNAELRNGLGHSILASTVNFGIGFIFLLGLCIVFRMAPVPLASITVAPWWAWTGGVVGALFVAALAVATRDLGAVLTFALILVGQFGVSIVCDHFGFLGYQQQSLTINKALGIVVLVLGVLLIKKG